MTGELMRSHEEIETIVIPGHGYQDEIESIDADIRDLDSDDHDYDTRHVALRAERKRLRHLPSEPDRVVARPTGRTIAQRWATLDDAGKLSVPARSHDAKVYAVKGPLATLDISF
jgi:hypothetical protein